MKKSKGAVEIKPTALSKNPIAKSVNNPVFKQRVVPVKTKYRRSRDKLLTSQILEENDK